MTNDPRRPGGHEPADDCEMSPALQRAFAAHPTDMTHLIDELHRRVHDEASLLDLMARAAREAVRMILDVDWAGVTAQFVGQPFTAAHTDQRVLIVDEGQYDQGDGPCLAAARTDRSVAMTIDQVRLRWPRLALVADAAGVEGFLARPLHSRAQAVGSLNMYSARSGGVRAPDPDVLTVLIEYLERGISDYSAAQLGEEQALRIKNALANRQAVDHAIGVLMALLHLDAEQAAFVLESESERRALDQAVVAAEVIAHHTMTRPEDYDDRVDPGESEHH